jgi:hypothetical protein
LEKRKAVGEGTRDQHQPGGEENRKEEQLAATTDDDAFWAALEKVRAARRGTRAA